MARGNSPSQPRTLGRQCSTPPMSGLDRGGSLPAIDVPIQLAPPYRAGLRGACVDALELRPRRVLLLQLRGLQGAPRNQVPSRVEELGQLLRPDGDDLAACGRNRNSSARGRVVLPTPVPAFGIVRWKVERTP